RPPPHPRALARSGGLVQRQGMFRRSRLLVHVLPPQRVARTLAGRNYASTGEPRRAEGTARLGRTAGSHRVSRQGSRGLGVARSERGLREAAALAGDEGGR